MRVQTFLSPNLYTFMEIIIWNICGNDNMEYLDCLRPFPRLDYDVREGQGAADWPTLTNSCYARPSPPLPEMLFASTMLVGNVQCTFACSIDVYHHEIGYFMIKTL